MLIFSQSTGEITRDGVSVVPGWDPDTKEVIWNGIRISPEDAGQFRGTSGPFAWAGRGEGKNNPAWQQIHNMGPLPQNTYSLGEWTVHPHLGPLVSELTPGPDQEMYGRDGFWIHGPGESNYGQESKGCVVIPRAWRELVRATCEKYIEVVG